MPSMPTMILALSLPTAVAYRHPHAMPRSLQLQGERRCSVRVCARSEVPSSREQAVTVLALGPLFVSQVAGDQFFVPIYLPLLMLCAASAGRIDGRPAAFALALATALNYGGTMSFAQPSSSFLIGVNAVACSLLIVDSFLVVETTGEPGDRVEGTLERQDLPLALVLTLGLALFLVTTVNPIAGLRDGM